MPPAGKAREPMLGTLARTAGGVRGVIDGWSLGLCFRGSVDDVVVDPSFARMHQRLQSRTFVVLTIEIENCKAQSDQARVQSRFKGFLQLG